MFGYIKPLEDELKLRQLALYRSVYCGLCHVAGKEISIFSRFFLSYDYTFFAIVRMIFEQTDYISSKKSCTFQPFAKKDVMLPNKPLSFSAAIFSLLTYYKVRDNIADEGFLRSSGARLLLPLTAHMRKKAVKAGYKEADTIVSDCLERISELENKRETSAERVADIFGDMMGYLLKSDLSEDKRDDAYSVGYTVGKFIYMADAVDDISEDEKKHRYNPFLCEYESAAEAVPRLMQLKNAMLRDTDTAADILSGLKPELPEKGVALCEIAQNILYLGCQNVLDSIYMKKK